MILVDFLGKVLGPQYEVVFHDLTDKKYEIAAIANGQISGRKIGAPLTDLALQFLMDKTYQESDYIANYCGLTKAESQIRSSTMFVKNEKGELIGMLCINCDNGKANEIVTNLRSLFQLDMPDAVPVPCIETYKEPEAAPAAIETFPQSIAHLVASVLKQTLPDSNIPKERLTQNEKLKIVDILNQKGIFLIKGAVTETAAQLCSSEASIYRYLSKLNRQK
jgi:predicted transcriptional regulator YheO